MAIGDILVRRVRRALGRALLSLGYEVRRTTNAELDATSFDGAMSRLFCGSAQLGVKSVIDIGASNGQWTEQVMRFLPLARYLLIEANRAHEPNLSACKRQHANVDYVIAAAADREGRINFDARSLFGGLATWLDIDDYRAHDGQSGAAIHAQDFVTVSAVRVDDIVAEKKLAAPYFLKMDVHGAELMILAGAEQTLSSCALVQIECYNFHITRTAAKFQEIVSLMESKGFRVIDLCDPVFRPGDYAFWQVDFFFVKADDARFCRNWYAP